MRLVELLEPIDERYTRDNVSLRDYFRKSEFDPYDYSAEIIDWLNDHADEWDVDVDLDTFESGDMSSYEDLPADMRKEMEGDIIDDLSNHSPEDVPTYHAMSPTGKDLLPRNTWLIHFSDKAWNIAHEGFTRGAIDMNKMALTTWQSGWVKEHPGYNFAFRAMSRDASQAVSDGKYGRDAVLFQNSGFEAYHHGDEENQVMFYGPDVDPRYMIYLEGDGHGDFTVKSRDGDDLYSGSYEKVVKWAIAHHQQYRKKLFSKKPLDK